MASAKRLVVGEDLLLEELVELLAFAAGLPAATSGPFGGPSLG